MDISQPSYKNSTLSMLLVWWVLSLPALAVLFAIVAVDMPNAYELISQDKLVVAILVGAYIVAWMQLLSAYLQRSQITDNNKTLENTASDTTTTTTSTTTPKDLQVIDVNNTQSIHDLPDNGSIVW